MKFKDRNKLIALLATLLCCVAIVLMLVFSYLDYEWPPKDMPLPPESEIIFGGEYVMLGNVPRPAKNKMDNAQPATQKEESQPDAQDMSNEGTAGDVPDLVSSDAESEMKVKKKEKPEKTGPTKEEIAERERIKREKEKAAQINKRVSFNTKGKGSGKEGSPSGNSEVGARDGKPGYDLKGRTMENWGRPNSPVDGVVIIEVRVNAQGNVIEASYKGGSGSAAANLSVRESCKQASLRSKFSVAKENNLDQVGSITWRFE